MMGRCRLTLVFAFCARVYGRTYPGDKEMNSFEEALSNKAGELQQALMASHSKTERELKGANSEMMGYLTDTMAAEQRLGMEGEKNLFILNLEKVMGQQGLADLETLTDNIISRIHEELNIYKDTFYDPLVKIRKAQKRYVHEFYAEIGKMDKVKRDQMEYLQNMEFRYRGTKELIQTLMKREMVEDRKLNGEFDQILRVAANVMQVSNQLQNELLERIGEGQTAVDDMNIHRTKLANKVINDLRVALFRTLESGDEKVNTRGKEIKASWEAQIEKSDETMDHLERYLEDFYRQFSQTALSAFGMSQNKQEKADEDMEKAVELEAEAKTKQREHSLVLKQGERDFRLDVSAIEKKALKNVVMEEKRLANLRKQLSGTIQNEALQVKQEEMSKGLSEINTKQEELHSKIDDFKEEAQGLIGEFTDWLSEKGKPTRDEIILAEPELRTKVTDLEKATVKAKVGMQANTRAILEEIRAHDEGLRQKLRGDKASIAEDVMKMERASTSLSHDAEDEMSKLKASGSSSFDALEAAKRDFQTNAMVLNGDISKRKRELGKKLQETMKEMQKHVETVGQLVNEEAPGARDAMVKEMKKVFMTLANNEQALHARVSQTRDATMETINAADDEVTKKMEQVPEDLKGPIQGENVDNMRQLEALHEWAKKKQTAIMSPLHELDKRALAANSRAVSLAADLGGAEGKMEQKLTALESQLKEHLSVGTAEFHSQLRGAEVQLEQNLNSLKQSEVSKVFGKEQRVVKELAALKEAAQSRASAEADQQAQTLQEIDHDFQERFEQQTDDLRNLTDGYKAHDQDSYTNQLKEALSATESALHTEKLLSAKNTVEQMAALDSHYASLGSLVQQEVDGVSKEKREYMQKLMDEAKAQTASMLASGAYSEEEIEERLAEVNSWLHASLQEVTEETGDAAAVFGTVEEADRNFTKEADDKIASMRQRLSADDTAKGVEREEDHAQVQADQLTKMLQVTESDIKAKTGAVQANLSAAQEQHILDKRRLEADLDTAKQSAQTILSDAAGRSRETLDGIAERVQQQEEEMVSANARLQTLEKSADEQHHLVAERIDSLTKGRKERLGALKSARNMLQVLAAESVAGLIQFLMTWENRARTYSRTRKEQLKHHSAQAEKLMGSEKIGLLQALSRADAASENMGAETEEMTAEAKADQQAMIKWHQASMKALQELGKDTESEVESMRAQAAQFGVRVHQVTQEARDDAAAEAASNEELEKRNEASAAGTIDGLINGLTAKSGAQGSAADATFSATQDMIGGTVAGVEDAAAANKKETDALTQQITTVSKSAERASALASQAAGQSATKAENDRAQVLGTLAGIAGAQGVSSFAELPSVQRLAKAEDENRRLAALHSELVAEAKALGG